MPTGPRLIKTLKNKVKVRNFCQRGIYISTCMYVLDMKRNTEIYFLTGHFQELSDCIIRLEVLWIACITNPSAHSKSVCLPRSCFFTGAYLLF